MKRINILKLETPVHGYNYNVQVLNTTDGNNFYYTGQGKYFHTEKEALDYKKEMEVKR